MAMGERVYAVEAEGIAEVVLNRPEARNALNRQMWESLRDLLWELEQNPNVRVVLITGTGKEAFSAGVDFSDLESAATDMQHIEPILEIIEDTMSTIEQMSKPVIAKVNGAAIGGGCELAAACDLRIAADIARFGIPAGRLGIAITWQDTRRLTALVGTGWARDLLMTGRVIDAHTAYRIGLVTRVVPAADLDREAEQLAKAVVAMAPITLKAAKLYTLAVAQGRELLSREEGLALARKAWASGEFRSRVKTLQEQRRARRGLYQGEEH